MADAEILAGFAVATFIFAYMPGPALVYAAAQTMAFGRAGGFRAALGLHLGGYVHVLAAALGLAAVLEIVPTLFVVVKLAGAAYMAWLGILMIRSGTTPVEIPDIRERDGRRAFFNSMTVEILNPKTALFFLAFLPQFVDPTATLPAWAQFLILGTVVNLTFSSADILAVMATDKVLMRLRRHDGARRLLKWVGGSILVGLGVHLAVNRA